MYEKLEKVKVGEYDLPIRCDINILGIIQEEFGSMMTFEQKLIGINPVKDKDGKPVIKEDGTMDYTMGEPNIHAIAFALPLFIIEGIAQAEEQGEDYSEVDWKPALKDADFNYIEIALSMYREFERCFKRKKKVTNTKSRSTKKNQTK